MPMQLPEPPADVTETIRSSVRSIRSGGTSSAETGPSPGAGARASDDVQLTDAHEVFNLGLRDLARDASLAEAQPVGWRYLVREGGDVIASAETVRAAGRSEQVFAQYNEGPFVASTARALAALADGNGDRGGIDVKADVEARLLHIPALHTMALWLRGADGDRLVPLAPTPPGIEAGRSYPADELLATLAARAQQALAGADDRSGG